jgi:hypothetical protein
MLYKLNHLIAFNSGKLNVLFFYISRCWTYLTWLILSSCDPTLPPLSEDIPDSDPFFPKYGPSFELAITQGMRTNSNSAQDLDDILEEAFGMIY